MAGLRAIGLMSGTSLDGVDVALIETDGESIFAFGPTGYQPYDDGERALLRRALAAAAGLSDRLARPGILGEAETLVTHRHAAAVEDFLVGNRHRSGQHRRGRLSRPDRAASAAGEADRADRRRGSARVPARPAGRP